MALRALLVGAGMMGRNHARVLQSLEGVSLVGIVDPVGAPHLVNHSAQLMESLDAAHTMEADIAIVATPTSQHETTSLRLLDMGLNVLVEKPIADSPEAGDRMVRKLSETGFKGAVGHIERFNPAIQELKRRLEKGEIGEIYQIATRRQGSFPERIGDVGVTKDLATHDLDFTSWICGADYDMVFGQAHFKTGRAHEDMIAVTGRMKNGVIVNHLVNWLSPMKERLVTVTGGKGTFVADTLTGDLTLFENGVYSIEWDNFASFRGVKEGNVTRYAYPKREPLRTELEGFRDLVMLGEGLHVSFEEATKSVHVAEGIMSSAMSGRPVHV